MPEKSLKPNASERDLKRRSTLDPLNLFRPRMSESEDVHRTITPPDRPESPPIQEHIPRFSLSKWRHASESQLSVQAKKHAKQAEQAERPEQEEEDIPPVPAMPINMSSMQRPHTSGNADNGATPSVLVTAPTSEINGKPSLQRRKSRFHPFTRQKQSNGPTVIEPQSARPSMEARRKMDKTDNRKSRFGTFRTKDPIEELRMLAGSQLSMTTTEDALSVDQPKAGSGLTLPMGRKSESSRSEGDLGGSYRGGRITPDRSRPDHSNSSFTWLSRRNKQRASLFPLPVRIPPPEYSHNTTEPQTPRESTSARSSGSPEPSSARSSPRRDHQTYYSSQGVPQHPPQALASSSISFAAPGALLRQNSTHSQQSSHSSPALVPPMVNRRTRSSTLGSNSGLSDEPHPPTPPFANGSGRNSTSTNGGRSSFSNLFSLNRLRHGSDPYSPRQGSPGHGLTPAFGSASNSLSISRESVTLPDREEGEAPMKYLSKVEAVIPKSQIPSALSKKLDDFFPSVMRSFMRKFGFFGDPLDMALRKILMEIDLPKETQQIDRVLQSFADRYHECNPGIFPDSGKTYFMTFSLLLLQSDFFNKSNKRKMMKQDYVKNAATEGVADDVLDCFYDNIIYTPFIRVEDEFDTKTIASRKSKRTPKVLKHALPEQAKRISKEPLDPYTLLLDNRLDVLRPPIKDVIALDNPYSYLGTAPSLDKRLLRSSKCGIIQVESSRSRPDAFMVENSEEAKVGVVDLPVDKVGLLWRKDPKKKTARSPWQEWGAILTGAGLYFFKNSGFVKNFIHQHEQHIKQSHGGSLCVFKPAITSWKADHMLPIDNSVALHDETYKKHKNAFIFFRHNNADEVFLADSESEMNDWLAKLNHQAAFKTSKIEQRDLFSGNYDGQRQRGIRRLNSSTSSSALQTGQTLTGEATIQSSKQDSQRAEIDAARRDNMVQKIYEAEERLAELIKIEHQHKREASHLLILAPIQERTRNQLMHAASRVSAQLKWTRIDIWRLKCHRDILAMDLEEEKVEAQRRQNQLNKPAGRATSITSQSTASTAKPKPNGIERLNSNATASTITSSPWILSQSPGSSRRPDTAQSEASVAEEHEASISSTETGDDDDVFRTPPERSPTTTPIPQSTLSDNPSSVQPPTNIHRGSVVSMLSRSPRLRPQSHGTFDEPLHSPSMSEYRTPMLTDEQAQAQREELEGQGSPNADDQPLELPNTATSTETDHEKETVTSLAPHPSITGSPETKSKGRRSLQRSLRDAANRDSQSSMHHRHSSRRGPKNDSTSSAILPEEAIAEDGVAAEPREGLKREKGSFTVHGKKASVITFETDWAEERLKGLTRNESQTSTANRDGNGTPMRTISTPLTMPSSESTETNGNGKGKEKEVNPSRSNSQAASASTKLNSGKERRRAMDLSSLQQLEKALGIPPRKSSLSLRERRAASGPASQRKPSTSRSSSTPGPTLLESPMPADAGNKVNGIVNGDSGKGENVSEYEEGEKSENKDAD